MAKTQHTLLAAVFLAACAAVFVSCELVAKEAVVPEEMKWKNPEHAHFEKMLLDASEQSNDARRVVGGTPATPGQYPWITSLRKRGTTSRYNRHFCGGSLIGDGTNVLTAAHCTIFAANQIEAGFGDYDLSAASESSAEVRNIKTSVKHPRYNPNSMVFDYAVWTLSSKSTKTPVALVDPSQNLTYPGALATIAGWGTTSYQGSLSPVLLKANVPIVDKNKCATQLELYVASTMICAGYDAGGVDTCQGDSGGPIFFNVGGQPVVVGDTSFGFGCASPNSPGVYGNALVALPFIDAITKGTQYLTIKSVNINFFPFTQSLSISTTSIDLGKNTVVKNASITIVLTSKLSSGTTTTFTSTGKTSSSGTYTFSRAVTSAGTYTACVTSLSATGYSKVDLSENCAAIKLV